MALRRGRAALERTLGLDARRSEHARLSDAELRQGLGDRTPQEAGAAFVEGAASLGWPGLDDRARLRSHLTRYHLEHVAAVRAAADDAVRGRVLLFGHLPATNAENGVIEWQRDWQSGRTWESGMPSSQIPIGREPGMDPRIAWELGRGHELVTLGQAYVLTGESAYALEVLRRIESFIQANPVGRGVQWASTMDAAIRAANWLLAWDLIRAAPEARRLADPLLRSLVEHGRFVLANLENRDGLTSNHYLADLAGLAYLSRLGGLWPAFKPWQARWEREIGRELRVQTLADGFTFEASVCYHRLAVELTVMPAALDHGALAANSGIAERVRAAADAVIAYTTDEGRAPQFGDNDSGHLHVLQRRDDLDHGYLVSLAGRLTGTLDGEESAEEIWVFGPASAARRDVSRPRITVLRDAGIAAVRDAGSTLIATCGPNGQADRGGHAHNDKLSFVLFVNGADAVVDPGTFCYTGRPDLRQAFRATAAHATLALDGEEQNRFSLISVFRLIPDARPEPWRIRAPGGSVVLASAHTGYERRPLGLRHERRILHRSGTGDWVILDCITATSRRSRHREVSFAFALPFAPRIQLVAAGQHDWRMALPGGGHLVGTTTYRHGTGRWEQDDGWYSRAYGSRERIVRLRLTGTLRPRPHAVVRTEIHVAA